MSVTPIFLTPRETSLAGKVRAGDTTLVFCNMTDAAFTVTLPHAGNQRDSAIIVQKTDSSTNAITLACVNNQTINGSSTFTVDEQYECAILYSDGSNWVNYNDGSTLASVDALTLNGSAGTYYLSRMNHTGTQMSTTISDFTEAAQDAVGSILGTSSTITLSYTDATPSIAAAVVPGGVDHALLANLNSTTYSHLTGANLTDLTDGGTTTLHAHAHGGTANYITKFLNSTTSFTNSLVTDDGTHVTIASAFPGGIFQIGDNGVYVNTTYTNTINVGYNDDSDTTFIRINNSGYLGTYDRFRDLFIGDGKTNNIFYADGSSGNIAFGKQYSFYDDWLVDIAVLQSGFSSALFSDKTINKTGLSTNLKIDSTSASKKIVSGYSTKIIQENGTHKISVSDTGTAGSTISWLDAITVSTSGSVSFLNGSYVNSFSTDGTFLLNSDSVIPTEKAIKAYVGSAVSSGDADQLDGQHGAYYLSRDNHTGTQASTTISDFTEAAQDAVGGMVGTTASLTLAYDDSTPSILGTVVPGGVDHALLSNLNSATYTHLTSANHTDLTDGGDTGLHSHLHGGTANYIAKFLNSTTSFTNSTITDDGALVTVNAAGGDVDFKVLGTSSGVPLFVDAGNNRIGMGTAAPSVDVDMGNASNARTVALFSNAGSNVYGLQTDVVNGRINILANGITISSFGYNNNFGVNTVAPENKIHAYLNDTSDALTANGSMLILEQDSTGDAGIQFELTAGQIWSTLVDNSDGDKFKIYDITNTSERLSITPAGIMAINGSGADVDFEVLGTSSGVPLFVDAGMNSVSIGTNTISFNNYRFIVHRDTDKNFGIGLQDNILSLETFNDIVGAMVDLRYYALSHSFYGGGISSVGGNITLNANYLSGDGGNEGLQIGTTGIGTFSSWLGVGGVTAQNVMHTYLNDTSDALTANGSMLILEQDSTGDAGIQFELTGGQIWTALVDNSDGDKFKIYDITGTTTALSFSPLGAAILGSTLAITTIADANEDTDKFLVSSGGTISYRTGSETLADIGGMASTAISGTQNYLAKFGATGGTVGNSIVQDDGTNFSALATGLSQVYGATGLILNSASGDVTLSASAETLNLTAEKYLRITADVNDVSITCTTGTLYMNTSLAHLYKSDAGTSSTIDILELAHYTSGAAANGFGVNQTFKIENTSGTLTTAGRISNSWLDADAQKSKFDVSVLDGTTMTTLMAIDPTSGVNVTGPLSVSGVRVVSSARSEGTTATITGNVAVDIGGYTYYLATTATA